MLRVTKLFHFTLLMMLHQTGEIRSLILPFVLPCIEFPFTASPFHPLLGFISNVHQAGVDLALTFSLLSLISPLQTSDFNDFLLFLATVNGIGFSFLLRLGTSFAFLPAATVKVEHVISRQDDVIRRNES